MTSEAPGFALIEAVVALGIVAAILGVTFQTIGAARGALAGAEDRRLAMLEARSISAQLGATVPLVPGTAAGQSGRFRWRVDIESVDGREVGAPLNRVVISIADDRARTLARLHTLRLGR